MKLKKELVESFLPVMKTLFLEEFSIFLGNSLFIIMIIELTSKINRKSFIFSLMKDYLGRSIGSFLCHQLIKTKMNKTQVPRMK